MKQSYDIIIAGAGPSGLHAARRLAEKGYDVLVLEKKAEVGESVNCTGIIGRETFERFSLSPESRQRDIQDVRLVSPSGVSIVYKHPKPFACIVDRRRFDRDMAKAAEAAGAEIRTGCSVKDLRQEGEGVSVETGAGEEEGGEGIGTYRARAVVLATGVQWELSRKAGLGVPRGRLVGAQVELEAPDVDIPAIYAGTEIAAGGFAWAVPTAPGKAKFGLITESDPRGCFHMFADKHLGGSYGSGFNGNVQYKIIAQGPAIRTSGRAVISLGEAAGQVKTTTGGGISYGLHCAEIAASVIGELLRHEGAVKERDLQEYDRAWRKALQKEIQLGLFARKIWSRLSDAHIESAFRVAQEDGLIPLVQNHGDFDWHSGLIMAFLRQASLSKILSGAGKAFLPFRDSRS
ncbi:MAG: NAD(P)/FAD-dependent oxidoreductase [Candidatus Aminicenantes bacterium]|nr:NAD(P)/FAD-dependent oxidoreductase [Candidatus Aminicenantes bacterium]